MIWKDGTKMDNGICIQTMPTQNYFISLWNMKLTLRILFQLSQKKAKGRSPRQIFCLQLDLGITNSTGVVPCSERPSFGLKIASKFFPQIGEISHFYPLKDNDFP